MTAPDAVPETVTVDELAEALRRDAEGDRGREAAGELLAAHRSAGRPGHWLRRGPVLDRITWMPADDEGSAFADIRWHDVAALLDDEGGEPAVDVADVVTGSLSEITVLQIAVSLAHGALSDAVTWCDDRTRVVIVDAVAHAFQVGVS